MDPDETTTPQMRLNDGLITAVLESIVAVATLVYCYFFMPLFFAFTNAWLQMLWLCVLHPLYFEMTTGFVVRKVLHRNRVMGRNHVVSKTCSVPFTAWHQARCVEKVPFTSIGGCAPYTHIPTCCTCRCTSSPLCTPWCTRWRWPHRCKPPLSQCASWL